MTETPRSEPEVLVNPAAVPGLDDKPVTAASVGSAGPRASGWLDKLSERQTTLLVILFGLLLYIPFAGSYGLWDPWETHYSEVARQMTKRGDFISLWWPGSPRDPDVFWSKPVFTFWVLSLAMHVAGVGLRGNPADEMALTHRAEWAVRVPMCLFGTLALYSVFLLVSRLVSRRAGVLSALVLATCPMFSLIARQAMTDMPFVGPMALALALGGLALYEDEPNELPRRRWKRFSWPHHPVFYLTIALFALMVVPQLVIDSVDLKFATTWSGHRVVMFGAVAMIPYYIGTLLFIAFAARARWKAPLYLTIAAMMCGIAVLAKGFAGLGLPVIVFVAYLAFTWNWKRLRRAQLLPAILFSLVACVVVAAPWHHAMILRHGWGFWNELFGDNHWRRMVMGRHGDNNGLFDYFLRELGYGVLPWVALAPAALVTVVSTRATSDPRAQRRQAVLWLGTIWFVMSYAVVSVSMTKFHHYILPAIPGLAIVIGCYLDEQWEKPDRRALLLAALVGVPFLGVIVFDLVHAKSSAQLFLWLFSYDYIHSPNGRPWPEALDYSTTLVVFGVLFALGTLGLAIARKAALVGLGLVAVAFTFFLLDGYMRDVAPYWSQKDAIASYYKERASKDEKLVAYQMYWRGETFYTKNEIYEGPQEDRTVFDMEGADDQLSAWIKTHRGRRVFFMFERARQGRLISLLPPESRSSFTVINDRNNKFSVARADI